MLTVALFRLTLSMSLTLRLASTAVAAPFSVKASVVPVVVTAGASLTAPTVMPTLSLSDSAPPLPVLPWSLLTRLSTAAPLKFAAGAKTRPFSAVLMALMVPVKVIAALPLAPPVKLRPAVPPRVSTPFVTVNVTCKALAPASTSLTLIALPLAALNTSVASSLTACAAGMVLTGASFTAVTVIALLNVALLNAVLPPLLLASAVPPAVPLLWSQARRLSPFVTLPFQFAFGTKRTQLLASVASRRAVVALGVPKAVQLAPASVEYCQAPLLLSTAVTATPRSAALSTSLTCPAISADTSVPALLAASSFIDVRLLAPASTGASLTALTLMLAVSVTALYAVLAPFAELSTLLPALPLV